MKKALLIGRFQPFHHGHIDAIQQIEEKGAKQLIICVGSAQEKHTLKNPFTYDERKNLIEKSLEGCITIPYQIFPVPDFPSDSRWKNYIVNVVGEKFT